MKIAVVGAGIAGLVSAYMAARAGHEVVVFEKEKIGAGASGLALGVLVPIGLQRKVDALQRSGVAAWPELIADLGGGEEVLRAWPPMREPEVGEAGGRLSASGKFSSVGELSVRYQLRVPEIFGLLKDGIVRLGGVVKEGVQIGKLEDLAGFDAALVAAGWGNAGFGVKGMTVWAGQAIRLRPPAPLARLVTGEKITVCPEWDGGVLVGSINWKLREPGDGVPVAKHTAELVARAVALVPELEGAEVVDAWVGYRPINDPRLPLVRPLGDKIWAVAGLGQVGFALAPEVGKAFLQTIEEEGR